MGRGGERRGKTPARARRDLASEAGVARARGNGRGTRGGGRGRKGAGERTREGEQHSFERVVKSPRLPRTRFVITFLFLLFLFFYFSFQRREHDRFFPRVRRSISSPGTISMSRRLFLFLFAFYRVRLDPLDRLVDDGFSLSSLGRENARLSHTRVTTVDYCAFRNGPTGKRAPAVDREKRRGSGGMVKRREREKGREI